MKNKLLILLLAACLTLTNCEKKSTIEGLWVVKSVKVGEDEMTPNGRWSKFNADFTQESGNGWFQHSIGTWSLNPETHELTIINTNGLNDPYDPFKVTMENNNTMTWKRNEEGQDIQIFLERSNTLPTTYGDELLGLWQLEETFGNGPYFESDSLSTNSSIFFRWDRRFVLNSEKGRISGVYNVHGHKPEVELIPYGSELNRNFWKIDFGDNSITLHLLNSDSTVTRQFKRIHEFPKN